MCVCVCVSTDIEQQNEVNSEQSLCCTPFSLLSNFQGLRIIMFPTINPVHFSSVVPGSSRARLSISALTSISHCSLQKSSPCNSTATCLYVLSNTESLHSRLLSHRTRALELRRRVEMVPWLFLQNLFNPVLLKILSFIKLMRKCGPFSEALRQAPRRLLRLLKAQVAESSGTQSQQTVSCISNQLILEIRT